MNQSLHLAPPCINAGDTAKPFAELGQSLNLPQMAVLALQAPAQIPLLEEEAYQWWDSFDQLGEGKIGSPNPARNLKTTRLFARWLAWLLVLIVDRSSPAVIQNPNPTKTLALFTRVLEYLTSPTPQGCGWHPSRIHCFGFAQGGSCAAELALQWSRSRPAADHLGSLVCVSAPLLSHPTLSTPAATKVCLVYRAPEERSIGVPSWRKGFQSVKEVKLPGGRGREGMPRGMDEWRDIMRWVRSSPSFRTSFPRD